MNDAQVYEMQVQIWKPNTWGVTAAVDDRIYQEYPNFARFWWKVREAKRRQ
jgi:hypothetical protein